LGRIVKTVYILRYLHDPAIRDRVQLQLNRGESRHELARCLFFANQGVFRSGDYEEIMNKVSALAVLSNAALVWNTVAIRKIVDRMRASGAFVLDQHLARVSPLLHAHIIPSGTYHFERLKQLSQP
jgi:TnpA family transposase